MAWLTGNIVPAVDGVAFGLLYFTLAVGLSLVFGMMDVLNLAHGTLYLGGAYVAYRLSDGSWAGLLVALAVGVVLGAAGGALLAVLTRPLAARGHLDQALLTLGLSVVAADLFLVAGGGEHLPAPPPAGLDGGVEIAGLTYPAYRLVFIGVAAVLALAVYLGFERSPLGAVVRATVADRDMVRALGVDTRVVLVGVFAVGAVLAAVGGVLGAPILAAGPGVDVHVLVMSLVVVVLGGLGSVRGALAGALIVGLVQSLGTALVPELASFLLFGAMFVVLAVRPRGLFPARSA